MGSIATETWELRVSTDWAAQIWCRPENEHRDMDVDFAVSIAKAMQPYLAPFAILEGHDRKFLNEIITQLKQTSGESWAVGEMVERALILLDFHEEKESEHAKVRPEVAMEQQIRSPSPRGSD